MQLMSKLTALLLTAALFVLGPLSSFASPQGTEGAPLKLGAILTLSGNFAAAGDDSRRGIEAALASQGNVPRMEIVYADSRNEPSVAIAEYQKLTHVDQVMAVYTHRSSIGMALNPISLSDKFPLLGAVGHQDFAAKNEYAIQAWPRAHDEGNFVAEEFKKRGYKRVAVLYTEDEWTGSVSEGFRSHLKKLGVNLAFDQSVLPGEQDFRTHLAKLKATSPEAIYFNFLLPQIGPALKQAHEMNLAGSLYSNFYLAKKEVRDAAGKDSLEGVRYIELDNSLPNLKKIFGKDEAPPGLAVAAYLSTLMVLQAANSEPRPSNVAELESSLSRQTEIRTPDGNYVVSDRCIKFPLIVKIMRNGEFVKDGKAG